MSLRGPRIHGEMLKLGIRQRPWLHMLKTSSSSGISFRHRPLFPSTNSTVGECTAAATFDVRDPHGCSTRELLVAGHRQHQGREETVNDS